MAWDLVFSDRVQSITGRDCSNAAFNVSTVCDSDRLVLLQTEDQLVFGCWDDFCHSGNLFVFKQVRRGSVQKEVFSVQEGIVSLAVAADFSLLR